MKAIKILIAVVTCMKFAERVNIQRRTWVKDVEHADVRFFVGQNDSIPGIVPPINWALYDDVEVLNVADDYLNLRRKVQKMFAWAVEQGYDYIFKTDDDTLVLPRNLFAGEAFMMHDYIGRHRGPSGGYLIYHEGNLLPTGMDLYGNKESSFASGFGYWLSKKAAKIVANAPDNGDWAEDRFVGNVLAKHNIRCVNDSTVRLWPINCGVDSRYGGACPTCLRAAKAASVLCPYSKPDEVEMLYTRFGVV